MGKVHPEYRAGEIIGYRADCGKQADGTRLRPFFKTKTEADRFNERHDSDKHGPDIGIILDKKREFLRCQERCSEMGITLEDAVQFYALHGDKKTQRTITEVIEEWVDDKRRARCREVYLTSARKHFDKFADFVTPGTPILNVTRDQVSRFVDKFYESAENVTQLNVYRNLSVLFNYAIDKGYLGLNPVGRIQRPKAGYKRPKVITPEDFATLLNRCYAKKWHDRLTVFVLVGFCGVRTEEASKLTWNDIDFKAAKVFVSDDIAKKHAFRRNVIPPNALAWLTAIRDKRRTGPIIGSNFTSLLRTAVKFARINHSKNCIRHSFCSYSLEAGRSLEDVVADMGHYDPKMIHSHYRNVVEADAARKWWAILPPPRIFEK